MILEKLRNAFFSSATGFEWFHRKRGRSQNPFVKCCQFSIFESSLTLAELIQEARNENFQPGTIPFFYEGLK